VDAAVPEAVLSVPPSAEEPDVTMVLSEDEVLAAVPEEQAAAITKEAHNAAIHNFFPNPLITFFISSPFHLMTNMVSYQVYPYGSFKPGCARIPGCRLRGSPALRTQARLRQDS
jgi:hypothetical protein